LSGGFTFNGIHCSTFGLAMLAEHDPVLPPTRDRKEEINGMDGAWDFGADYGPRPITVEVALSEDTRANLKALKRQLAAWLNAKNGVKQLTFDDEPGVYYLARYAGKIPLEQLISAYDEFTIPFVAYDPIGWSEELVWEQIVDTGTFVINNSGTYDAKPVITLQALDGGMPGDEILTGGYDPLEEVIDTITNPVITLNGYTISYTGTISPGESLVIDCQKLQATIDSFNAANGISGDFPVLGPGDNNLSVTDETSTGGMLVKIEYNGRWL